jgi:cytochrome c553
MEKYIKGERPHDEEAVGGLLNTLKEEDLQDILAYVTSIQERQ